MSGVTTQCLKCGKELMVTTMRLQECLECTNEGKKYVNRWWNVDPYLKAHISEVKKLGASKFCPCNHCMFTKKKGE